MSAIVLFGLFLLFMLFSVPIGYALGLAGLISMVYYAGIDPINFVICTLSGCNTFTLMAIPFFMLAGNLMATGGIAKRIVNFVDSIFGFITGGLSIVTTLACMFFGAISGSALATTTAIGSFMIPEMEKAGYDKPWATTLAASAGSVGVIIPPSIPFVLYCISVNQSVRDLFTAGIIPGLMMGLALIVVCVIKSRRHKWGGNNRKPLAADVWKKFKDGFWALIMPVIVLGGIYGGIFTPTEASVISVVYCVVISVFVYKEMTFKELYASIYDMVILIGVTMFIMGFAEAFNYYLTLEKIPELIANAFLTISDNPVIVILMINFLLLIVGCVLDNIPATIILSPILMPVAAQMGMDPITFGVVLTMNLAIGFVTPPYGFNLFIAGAIADVPLELMYKHIIPFCFALFVVLMLITFVPWFTLCLL